MLRLRVGRTGTRTWHTQRRKNGRAVRTILGKWPAMSVEQARVAALGGAASVAPGLQRHSVA